ncbi:MULTISPECIES: hypothetical protein [Pseudomonas aeruginosa group]|uniref:Uncharacterized protein n=2 Tax=Pseudomonas aeruginosa group TaxID=136841 RepID=A6UXN5_PSEP7|nr:MULTISPECIES: hypothetical protein [Pseudomonas aeruginosa group]ABR81400.2 hypothetical protein PSPA7_0174 [Pseudomonas aeruginosa PA7]MCW8360313.1 hypothetical protein [Pseudomonas aeruginosa]MCW8364744.1 hypothetical protein [Pseudomonas aeruginosa]MCW8412967.1 hypothetical protein [Pseudomonas aeruginosa]MCX3378925.1 hypothetical protein [Pseudomonas aeruginosa]
MDANDRRFSGFSLSTGVLRYSDLAYLLATSDEDIQEGLVGTLLFTIDRGTPGAASLDWLACSGTVCHLPSERYVALGVQGQVRVMGGGSQSDESISNSGRDPRSRGPLREVRGVARGRAYAVGTCRQAYVREDEGVWRCIDQTAQGGDVALTDTSFESIDGFSEQEIYTVGWEGEIWSYDGSVFTQASSPTNLALYKVRCAGDGYAYACGQLGTLLRGRGDKWEIIEHESTREDLWGMEYFDGHLYVSSTHFVYRLVDGRLERVDFGDDVPASCYHLSAADGIMWSVGAKDVMEFDGQSWKRILEIQ